MFNELSLGKVNSREIACDLLQIFIQSYMRAKEIGFEEIRLHENSIVNLYSIPLYDGYNIDDWLKDKRINEDLRDRFKEIVTSSPLIQENEVTENDLYDRSEFYKDLDKKQYQVWGLGAAYIYDTLSFSLNTHNEWRKSEVLISHYYVKHDLTDVKTNVDIRNFCNIETLNSHMVWWENFQKQSLKQSAELWEKKGEFFPNLGFSKEVESQLKMIGVSKTLFQIIDRLRALDKYVGDWQSGEFSFADANQNTNLRISPESQTTLRKYGALRKFTIPNGNKMLFDLHIKTGDLRFHFYPDNANRKIYIGYIGKHLRIASED